MVKTVAAVLLAACLVHSCYASVAPKECLGSPTTRCSAVSTLQILVTEGRCNGTSRADCKTWSQSENVFQESFIEWWSEGDKICDGDTVATAAKAVATAIANVWTTAAVNVSCIEGRGFACGWSFANGEAFGASIAEAVAQAAADASLALESSEDDGASAADAFCFSDVRAIGGALARAATTAAEDACVSSGDAVSKYTNSFASAIETVIADAFASATASTCATKDKKGGSDVTASSLCAGEGSVDDQSTVKATGNFCFGTREVPQCTGPGAEACCTDSPRRVCSITKMACKTCNGPWMRMKKGENVLFEDDKGNLCLCGTS